MYSETDWLEEYLTMNKMEMKDTFEIANLYLRLYEISFEMKTLSLLLVSGFEV